MCSVWKIHQAEYLGYMHFSVRVMHFSKKLEKRSYKHKPGNHSLRRLGIILAILQGRRNKLAAFSWLSHNSWHEPSHPCYLFFFSILAILMKLFPTEKSSSHQRVIKHSAEKADWQQGIRITEGHSSTHKPHAHHTQVFFTSLQIDSQVSQRSQSVASD